MAERQGFRYWRKCIDAYIYFPLTCEVPTDVPTDLPVVFSVQRASNQLSVGLKSLNRKPL